MWSYSDNPLAKTVKWTGELGKGVRSIEISRAPFGFKALVYVSAPVYPGDDKEVTRPRVQRAGSEEEIITKIRQYVPDGIEIPPLLPEMSESEMGMQRKPY